MYRSLVFLSPDNPWWVVESHARSVLSRKMRPVRRTVNWGQYARSTKEARVGPAGILEMFALTLRRSWKHELEGQEKPETQHTGTWCGTEQGTRSLVSRWGWRRSLARWEPKERAAVRGEQVPAVGDTWVLVAIFPLPVFTFYLFLPFSKQFPKNQWKKHIIQSYLSQSW